MKLQCDYVFSNNEGRGSRLPGCGRYEVTDRILAVAVLAQCWFYITYSHLLSACVVKYRMLIKQTFNRGYI